MKSRPLVHYEIMNKELSVDCNDQQHIFLPNLITIDSMLSIGEMKDYFKEKMSVINDIKPQEVQEI